MPKTSVKSLPPFTLNIVIVVGKVCKYHNVIVILLLIFAVSIITINHEFMKKKDVL